MAKKKKVEVDYKKLYEGQKSETDEARARAHRYGSELDAIRKLRRSGGTFNADDRPAMSVVQEILNERDSILAELGVVAHENRRLWHCIRVAIGDKLVTEPQVDKAEDGLSIYKDTSRQRPLF